MSSLTFDIAPRWRAKADEGYWYITRDMQVVRTWDWGKEGLPFKTIDELRNESGNYFSDKEEAEHYASVLRDTLIQNRCLQRAGSKDLYYFVDTSIPRSVDTYEWADPTREDAPSISLYASGNYFLTEEEARNFCHLFVATLQSRDKNSQ